MKPSLPLLAAISGVGSFSMAIIVPALPAMTVYFKASAAEAQFLLSAYIVGLAVTLPLWGPLADLFGRRRTALTGLSFFIVSSLACTYADTLETLVLLRAVQAVGASVGTVAARAVVRDCFSVEEGARAMSWVTIGQGAAPIVAPIIGGMIITFGSFEGLFVAMAIMGCALWLLIFLLLPETLTDDSPKPSWAGLFRGYGTLLGHAGFLGYTAVFGFIQGSFFAFLAVGAAIFADSFDMGPTLFGTIWGTMGVSYVFGAAVAGRISSTARRPLLLPIGIIGTLLLSFSIPICELLFGTTLAGIIVPLFLLMTLAGGVSPLVMAGAVYQVPNLAGTAAGLSSAIGMTVGGVFTAAAGFLYVGEFTPVAALISAAGVATFLAWLTIRRR